MINSPVCCRKQGNILNNSCNSHGIDGYGPMKSQITELMARAWDTNPGDIPADVNFAIIQEELFSNENAYFNGREIWKTIK
jgi:hypothetical protein